MKKDILVDEKKVTRIDTLSGWGRVQVYLDPSEKLAVTRVTLALFSKAYTSLIAHSRFKGEVKSVTDFLATEDVSNLARLFAPGLKATIVNENSGKSYPDIAPNPEWVGLLNALTLLQEGLCEGCGKLNWETKKKTIN